MSRKFRHGFKAESEAYAEEFRLNLGLKAHEPLCPKKLAEFLNIPVFGVSTNKSLGADIVAHWKGLGSGKFSGLILQHGTFKEIHHNDFHHPRRQNSNIAHELAHIILGHDLKVPLNDNGERQYEPGVEDEAKWLGATLLLPKAATYYIVKNDMPRLKIETDYGVSYELFRYRVQVTDTIGKVQNSRSKRKNN